MHYERVLLFSNAEFQTDPCGRLQQIEIQLHFNWKSTKGHIYRKDSQDTDGLEDELSHKSTHKMAANTFVNAQP